MLKRFGVVVVAAFVLVWASPALAASDAVTNTSASASTPGSLPYEVANASPGDTITFDPSLDGSTITLTASIPINENLTIDGPGASMLTISGGGSTNMFEISTGQTAEDYEVSISGLTFTDGLSPEFQGGAILSDSTGTLTVSNCVFSDNSAGVVDGGGGAIDTEAGPLVVTDSTFTGNSSGGDAGVEASSGIGQGGALSSQTSAAASITVIGSTFDDNHAGGAGAGGMFSGSGYGGAILDDALLTVVDSTFTDNTAGGASGPGQGSGRGIGGAIDFEGYFDVGQATLTSDTIDGNSVGPSSASEGSGLSGAAATAVDATIISGNTGASNCDQAALSSQDSLEGPAGSTSCGFDLPSGDPLLGPLADNGGPTETQALPADSPATGTVPAADCPAADMGVDQRGDARPAAGQSSCDVGAYELQSGSLPATQTTVSCAPNPAPDGSASVCMAKVTSSAGAPTGSVNFGLSPSSRGTFAASGCTLAAVAGDSDASSCTDSFTPASGGEPTIEVEYENGDDAPSTASTTLTYVAPSSTTTTLKSSTNPALTGQAILYTATVLPSPSGGTVAFTDGETAIPGCSAVAVSNGVARCSATYTAAGSHAIVASFAGTGFYTASSSPTVTEVVDAGKPATSVTLGTSANPTVTGRPVTLTATVSPAPHGGHVTFLDQGTAIPGCGALTVRASTGQVHCKVVFARSGPHAIKATYSGDTDHASSAAHAIDEIVRWSISVRAASGTGAEVSMKLSCAPRSDGCDVSARLASSETVTGGEVTAVTARARTTHRTATVGTKTSRIADGTTVTVTIKLNAAGRRLLTRFHKLPVTLTVGLTVNRQHSTVATRKLLMKPAAVHPKPDAAKESNLPSRG